MAKLQKIFFICLIDFIILLIFPKNTYADFCNSTGCWTSVICGNSYTLHCAYDCTCPASPCKDSSGKCVDGIATSEAGCDANGNPYIRCTGCNCGGSGPELPPSTPPPSASILGRVADGAYYTGGNCADCSGSCIPISGLTISCNSQETSWGCNTGGAFYYVISGFNPNTEVSCTATGLPSDKQFIKWSLYRDIDGSKDSGVCSGASCTASFSVKESNNHLWFYVATPTPKPVCPSCPLKVVHFDLNSNGYYYKRITWSDVTYEDGYKIYLCTTTTSSTCTPTYLTTLSPGTTSYTATNNNQGFSPGTRVIYEVRPFKDGCSGLKCTERKNDIPTPTATPTPTPTATPTPTPTPTPVPITSWFQTQEGDVHSNADLSSKLPEAGKFFSLKGEGGFPGIVSSFNNEPHFGQGKVSEKKWLATGFKNKKHYDYSYFNTLLEIPSKNIINNSILPSVLSGDKINEQPIANSPFWKIEGDLEVENLNENLGVKVFLASGKIIFKNDLNLQSTLPVFISQGDIKIEPKINILAGVLISSGKINSGKTDSKLTIKGATISWGNFSLERKSKSNDEPAEFFVYNPEIPLSLVSFLGRSPHLWEELAP